jgi:solute carrier family 25 thiamine pyrophosphate transporter 19
VTSAPFDVLKIRMQLSTGAISFSKVSGLECFVELARLAERMRALELALWAALWAGNVPALQLYGAYNAVQLGAFGTLKSSLAPVAPSPFLVGFLAGSTACVLATVATFPLDVLRTRGAASGVRRKEHTIAHAVSEATRRCVQSARGRVRERSDTEQSKVDGWKRREATFVSVHQPEGCRRET